MSTQSVKMITEAEVKMLLAREWGTHGVLTIWVDADPTQRTDAPVWAVEVREAMQRIESELRAGSDRERWQAFHERAAELEADIDSLVHGTHTGRGRMLVTGLDRRSEVFVYAGQHVAPTTVSFGSFPRISPMVAALDAGMPVGVIGVAREEASLWCVTMGVAELVLDMPVANMQTIGREHGLSIDNLPVGGTGDGDKDRREEHQRRYMNSVADLARRLATDRGWRKLIIAGDARLTQQLNEHLGLDESITVTAIDKRLFGVPVGSLAAELSSELAQLQREREQALVTRITNAVEAGGSACLGVSQTLALLAEDRVAHIAIDPSAPMRGFKHADGSLSAEPENAGSDTPVVDLAEHIIARALRAGVDVTPVDPPVTEMLASSDGIGAMLRW